MARLLLQGVSSLPTRDPVQLAPVGSTRKGPLLWDTSGYDRQDIWQQGVLVGGAEESMTVKGPKTTSVRGGTFCATSTGSDNQAKI